MHPSQQCNSHGDDFYYYSTRAGSQEREFPRMKGNGDVSAAVVAMRGIQKLGVSEGKSRSGHLIWEVNQTPSDSDLN